jgi:DNA-binding CsgD family transcriptional regulator
MGLMISSRDLNFFSTSLELLYAPCEISDFPKLVLSQLARVFDSREFITEQTIFYGLDSDRTCPLVNILPHDLLGSESSWMTTGEVYKIAEIEGESTSHRLEIAYWRRVDDQEAEERKEIFISGSTNSGHTQAVCVMRSDIICLNINRSYAQEQQRDLLLVNLIFPHLIQARSNAGIYSQKQQDLAMRDRVIERANAILLSSDRAVKLMANSAEELLKQYFEWDKYELLPETLDNWIKEKLSVDNQSRKSTQFLPLRVDRAEWELIIRLDRNILAGEVLLLLEEQPKRSFSINDLQLLGLTAREAEILILIAQDCNNQAIAEQLNTSPNTIKKHLERIYTKLNVSTRSAAVMTSLNKLGLL